MCPTILIFVCAHLQEKEVAAVDLMLKGIFNMADYATGKLKKVVAAPAQAKMRGNRGNR